MKASVNTIADATSSDAEALTSVEDRFAQLRYVTIRMYNSLDGNFVGAIDNQVGDTAQSVEVRFLARGPGGASAWSGYYSATRVGSLYR